MFKEKEKIYYAETVKQKNPMSKEEFDKWKVQALKDFNEMLDKELKLKKN